MLLLYILEQCLYCLLIRDVALVRGDLDCGEVLCDFISSLCSGFSVQVDDGDVCAVVCCDVGCCTSQARCCASPAITSVGLQSSNAIQPDEHDDRPTLEELAF